MCTDEPLLYLKRPDFMFRASRPALAGRSGSAGEGIEAFRTSLLASRYHGTSPYRRG
jgi:hypothetical protein